MWFSVHSSNMSHKRLFVNYTTHMTQLWAHVLGSMDHVRIVRHVMQLFTTVFERLPIMWILLGLLFNSGGLYLGFEYSLSFGYMVVGWMCCAYGLSILMLQRMERPRKSATSRLSPNFISVGSTVDIPATPNVQNERAPVQSEAE